MRKLSFDEERQIDGGAFSWWIAAIVIGAGVFVAGVIDGFTRPLKCR